jgi:membrane protein YdbS with pleckstrin-like domain
MGSMNIRQKIVIALWALFCGAGSVAAQLAIIGSPSPAFPISAVVAVLLFGAFVTLFVKEQTSRRTR